MDKRQLHYWHHRFVFLRAWYFLVPAVIFGCIAVYGLRANYSKMVQLRQAVYTADEQNGDIEGALNKLRSHVYGHMNTNLSSGANAIHPPIQLKHRYEQLAAGDKERVKQANAQVAAEADQVCAAQFPQTGPNIQRITCIQQYIDGHAVAKETAIPDALYKFDFISPRWSPDLAGFGILLSVSFLVLFAARAGLEYYVSRRLR